MRVSHTEFTTALFPKAGRYLIALKAAVGKAVGNEVDKVLAVALNVARQ